MNWKKVFTSTVILLLAVGALAGSRFFILRENHKEEPGHAVQAAPQAERRNATPESPGGAGSEKSEQDLVDLVVALDLRNEEELDRLLARQADPTSEDFQKFLSVTEFEKRFSPTKKDVDAVVVGLKQSDSDVIAVSPNRSFIHIRRKPSKQASLSSEKPYSTANLLPALPLHRNPFASDRRLTPSIKGISAIDPTMVYHPMHAHTKAQSPKSERTTPPGLSVRDIAIAYDFPNANNLKTERQAVYSGNGQRIAIVSAWGFSDADVEQFWSYHGVSRTGTVTVKSFGPGPITMHHMETTMNLEQVGAQAPGADIVMYLAANALTLWFDMALDTAVRDNVDIVSISWLVCERTSNPLLSSIRHNILKQAAAQGIAVFVSSGDQGAYCSQEPSHTGAQLKAVLDVGDSSDPFVTSVGGTTLVRDADGKVKEETAWSGGGGGVSTYFGRPHWQKGASLPLGDKRLVSDVAFVADPDLRSAYDVFFEGQWRNQGGTSFGAPNWAALWALAQEANGRRLGPANPLLYMLADSPQYATVFNDITQGNNGNRVGSGFSAAPGWDHPTGLGTPRGTLLIRALSSNGKPEGSR